MKTVPLRHLANLNPPTDELDSMPDDAEVAFLPLEAVWADSRADRQRSARWGDVKSGYTRFQAGDVVVPKVTPTFQAGRSMIVPRTGAGTTELHVLRARKGVDSRWICYATRSRHFLREGVTAFQGVAGLQRVPPEFVSSFRVADRSLEEQRRIADFLDDRIAQIDRIIAARREQIAGLADVAARSAFDAVRGLGVSGSRRPSRLAWLGDIPNGWPTLSVGSQFSVELGKMLDEKKQTGDHALPYLRNINVQWDRIDTSDVKVMDIVPSERDRFTVTAGDLLICEGGQPGRAAIWDGSLSPMGFQKALHRARSRGRSKPRWLLECLRVAVRLGAFAAENGQTTIGHVTNEQLRGQRFPFPDRKVQDAALSELDSQRQDVTATADGLTRSNELMTDYKSSLITAAVTGDLDVTTAGSGIPG